LAADLGKVVCFDLKGKIANFGSTSSRKENDSTTHVCSNVKCALTFVLNDIDTIVLKSNTGILGFDLI
jgi:hypothetical protein